LRIGYVTTRSETEVGSANARSTVLQRHPLGTLANAGVFTDVLSHRSRVEFVSRCGVYAGSAIGRRVASLVILRCEVVGRTGSHVVGVHPPGTSASQLTGITGARCVAVGEDETRFHPKVGLFYASAEGPSTLLESGDIISPPCTSVLTLFDSQFRVHERRLGVERGGRVVILETTDRLPSESGRPLEPSLLRNREREKSVRPLERGDVGDLGGSASGLGPARPKRVASWQAVERNVIGVVVGGTRRLHDPQSRFTRLRYGHVYVRLEIGAVGHWNGGWQIRAGRAVERLGEDVDVPTVDEIGVDTVAGSVSVGPGEVALDHGSSTSSSNVVSVLQENRRDSDRMREGTSTVPDVGGTGPGVRVRHVATVRLVQVDTVPTVGKLHLGLHTVRASMVEVEVGLVDGVGKPLLGLTGELEPSGGVNTLAERVPGDHSKTLGEGFDGLVVVVPRQKVVETDGSVDRDELRLTLSSVDKIQLGHPVGRLVGLNGDGRTRRGFIGVVIVGRSEVGSTCGTE
jgi:hypothetical protein